MFYILYTINLEINSIIIYDSFSEKNKKKFFQKKEGRPGTPSRRLGGPPLLGPTVEFGNYNGASPVCVEIVEMAKNAVSRVSGANRKSSCKMVPEKPQSRNSARGQTKADEARVNQPGTNVSCGRADPAKSNPAPSLSTTLFASFSEQALTVS